MLIIYVRFMILSHARIMIYLLDESSIFKYDRLSNVCLTLVPATVFLRRSPATGGYFYLQAYLEFWNI